MVLTEMTAVLFFRDIEYYETEFAKLWEKYYPDDAESLSKAVNKLIFDYVGSKENLIKIIDDYSMEFAGVWQSKEIQYCDILSAADMDRVIYNGTEELGRDRVAVLEKAKRKWAYHLDDFTTAVNHGDNLRILELSVGAGFGTLAILKNLQPKSKLISIDIDFKCVKNADGLAKYLGRENQACGLNANFWNLPFEDNTFEVVCSHYGIDESGELPRTMFQTARVLKNGGRFIGVSRKNCYDRYRDIFEFFNIDETEGVELAKKAGIYSGIKNLQVIAGRYDLELINVKEFLPDDSHHRVLYEFKKI